MGKSAAVQRAVDGTQADRGSARGVDVRALLTAMKSEDELLRLRALQQSCPCRVPWEVFAQVRKTAQRLRSDPSERVRAAAWHLEVDAQRELAMQGLRDRLREREDRLAEVAARRDRGGRRFR